MSYPNRYVCSALEEMRRQLKHLDENNLEKYRSLTKMMIEEVQSLVNRMEAAIGDWSDYEEMLEKKRNLKREIKKLKSIKDQLSAEGKNET